MLLIGNGRVITRDSAQPFIECGAVVCDGKVIVEVGDFKRFASAEKFAAYLGLVPGEDSSGGDTNRLSITKAGNRHVRLLLTEAAQCYSRGQIGFKSKAFL